MNDEAAILSPYNLGRPRLAFQQDRPDPIFHSDSHIKPGSDRTQAHLVRDGLSCCFYEELTNHSKKKKLCSTHKLLIYIIIVYLRL